VISVHVAGVVPPRTAGDVELATPVDLAGVAAVLAAAAARPAGCVAGA